jgi:hypothetical protein
MDKMKQVWLCSLFSLFVFFPVVGYCLTAADTLVLKGEKLLAMSPAAYYYNLLLGDSTIAAIRCPKIVYVPMWGQWVIAEDDDCHKAVINVVNVDTHNIEASQNEYGDFLQYYHKEVMVKKYGVNISPWNPGSLGGPYNQIYASLTFDKKNPVIEITFESWSWMADLHTEFHDYYLLNQDKWTNITYRMTGKKKSVGGKKKH